MPNADRKSYSILIDGRWTLEDLYVFPRAYEQVYFAFEALLQAEDEDAEERIIAAFQLYPWQGGYSAVNFYNQLKYATPSKYRPEIKSIKYASPGWIELFLSLPLATQIAASVTSVAGALGACNKVYHSIHSDLQKRKLLRIEVERKKIELAGEQLRFVKESSKDMGRILGLKSIKVIERRTKNPLVTLKILLSLYRRVRVLAEYQNKGKAKLK